ncbi:MAG: histidine phosphatase family protein [Notoacmeibacter sp.]|nr:histidine phosphatase family protein [Notoacmeibacter sp.]MCC0032978.1 histidine phosphatase family protein [Brucellaceae bacterium]
MSRVYLLRHARAAFPQPGMRDFDRPLEKDADDDAEALGIAMRANGQRPDSVVCSSARRTRETWDHVAQGLELDPDMAEFSDTLYCTDASGYIDVIRSRAGQESVMLIGHNPMLEEVAHSLSGRGNGSSALADGFATCGLAVIDFDTPLADVAPGKGNLQLFMTPEDL